jgi:hypothetical protein
MNSWPHSKTPVQRERVLSLLRTRGSSGATNVELNGICLRYGAGTFELRKMGYGIDTQREGESGFRFVLLSEPEVLAELPHYRAQQDFFSGRRKTGLPLFDEACA